MSGSIPDDCGGPVAAPRPALDALPLSPPMAALIARVPDEWGDIPGHYDGGVWAALCRRDLVESGPRGYRKTAKGRALFPPTDPAPEPPAAVAAAPLIFPEFDLIYPRDAQGRAPTPVLDVLAMAGGEPWTLAHVWGALRECGVPIPKKAEAEYAAALHFLLVHALKHGAEWRPQAIETLRAMKAGADAVAEKVAAAFDVPVDEVKARVAALARDIGPGPGREGDGL